MSYWYVKQIYPIIKKQHSRQKETIWFKTIRKFNNTWNTGDTLQFMATQISTQDSNFSLWDKGQLVVLLSQTKKAENSIFIGPKNETLKALTQLLLSKTQLSNYIEEVLKLVTVNNDHNINQNNAMQ